MVPFLLFGLIDLSIGLIIGKLVFNIPFVGSITFFSLSVHSFFLIAVLGLALFISTFSGSTTAVYVYCIFLYDHIHAYDAASSHLMKACQTGHDFNMINPVAYLMKINGW